jgi:serine/threonine protein kinase
MYLKTCPTCHARYPVEFEVCPQDGVKLESENEAAKASAEWSAGKVIGGKYRISSKLGEDEVASIYEAHTVALNAPRVIRALQPRFAADRGACEEFRKVADLLQKTAQANVIAVEGRGIAEDGRPFVATEFVRGRTLAELIQSEAPLEPLRACTLARQVALALGAAHRLGLLHLSLSPSNIVVSGGPEDESVKVQGFGAAYARMAQLRNGNPSSSLTLRDRLPGDPRYASPELALRARPELLDERADLYSLGVVFYEMLTGRLPFASAEAERGSGEGLSAKAAVAELVAHLEDSPAPLNEGFGGMEVPAPLEALVMPLLERRPELRIASARELIEKLELAETRVASLPKPGLRPQPAEREPAVSAERAPAPAPVAVPAKPAGVPARKPAPEPQLVPVLSSSEASLDALDLKLGAEPIVRPNPAAVPLAEATVAVVPPIVESPPSRADASSILFKTEPPKRFHFGRWALAAAVTLIVAAGAWFFIERSRTQWLGAGPLSPIKSDELRSVEGAPPTSQPSQPASQSAQSQGGARPASQQGLPPQQPALQSRAAAPAATQSVSPPDTSNVQRAGVAQAAGAAPSATAGSASTALKAPTGSAIAPPALSPEDIAAQVKRAIAAGDVFFELGQYDYAIRAYEGPLKYDPLNQELKVKIERARKAKAAEAQYLGQ